MSALVRTILLSIWRGFYPMMVQSGFKIPSDWNFWPLVVLDQRKYGTTSQTTAGNTGRSVYSYRGKIKP
ncbi:hypothetical protein CMK19_19125 [Candidatus Poribacteria bacterium]|nr:hypothetical protein [Candidatus Poribacteria bacterium]MEE2911565.1 hypothetical protein [Candidatus Poribacteria bacterium]